MPELINYEIAMTRDEYYRTREHASVGNNTVVENEFKSPAPQESSANIYDSDWREKAACSKIETSVFIYETTDQRDFALEICACCDVKASCLTERLRTIPSGLDIGVCGGTLASERKRLRLIKNETGSSHFDIASAYLVRKYKS